MKDCKLWEKNKAQQLLLRIFANTRKKDLTAQYLLKGMDMTRDYCYALLDQFEQYGLITKNRPKRHLYILMTEKGKQWGKHLRKWYKVSGNPTLQEETHG